MYDPIETDISYEYLQKLNSYTTGIRWAVIGGWGTFLHVRKEYLRAFGKDYLRSRDIDIFIDAKDGNKFLETIKELGFKEGAYDFRYELIYDREEKKIISSEKAKKKHTFNLIYVFLDVFSNKKTKKLSSWIFSSLEKVRIEKIEGYPVLDVNSLLELKITSLFEREKLDKELKDACDIYALLLYSGEKVKLTRMVKKAVEKIISRADLQDYIAEHVLGDSLKASLIIGILRRFW